MKRKSSARLQLGKQTIHHLRVLRGGYGADITVQTNTNAWCLISCMPVQCPSLNQSNCPVECSHPSFCINDCPKDPVPVTMRCVL